MVLPDYLRHSECLICTRIELPELQVQNSLTSLLHLYPVIDVGFKRVLISSPILSSSSTRQQPHIVLLSLSLIASAHERTSPVMDADNFCQ